MYRTKLISDLLICTINRIWLICAPKALAADAHWNASDVTRRLDTLIKHGSSFPLCFDDAAWRLIKR